MPITMTFSNETADDLLADLQRIFPALVTAGPLPPMQEQPIREAAPATPAPKEPEAIPPKKTRGKGSAASAAEASSEATSATGTASAEEATRAAGGASPSDPLSGAANAEKTPSASSAAETEASTTSASDAASVVDIEVVRAKLKTLGATDGLGHDKVFEVLGKYGAKNASTVPEDKRGELIAEIDGLLAAVQQGGA